MQLRFLGTTYAANSGSIETTQLDFSGKYRGYQIVFRGAQPKNLDVAAALQYRGGYLSPLITISSSK